MRITSGLFRSRKLFLPEGRDIRPTSDKVRQAVFNKLLSYGLPDEDTVVIDAFCGTGALGLEALSRGAAHCVFIDKARDSVALCKKNIDALGVKDKATILTADTAKIGPRPATIKPAQLVFLDPPYRQDLVPQALRALAQNGWLAPRSLCIAETESEAPDAAADSFDLLDRRPYGQTEIRFYRWR